MKTRNIPTDEFDRASEKQKIGIGDKVKVKHIFTSLCDGTQIACAGTIISTGVVTAVWPTSYDVKLDNGEGTLVSKTDSVELIDPTPVEQKFKVGDKVKFWYGMWDPKYKMIFGSGVIKSPPDKDLYYNLISNETNEILNLNEKQIELFEPVPTMENTMSTSYKAPILKPLTEEKRRRLNEMKEMCENGTVIPLYRVWDPNYKSYNDDLRVSPNGIISTADGDEISPSSESQIGKNFRFPNRKYNTFCVVEKCAQRQDKNKRYIFEGDIVNIDFHHNTSSGIIREPARVVWENEEFHYLFADFCKRPLHPFKDDVVEVIGNIHTVSELFKTEVNPDRFAPLPIKQE